MKANPYNKFLTKEDRLHIAVYNYIRMQYPSILCVHVANEAKRTTFERWKAKAMGLTAGVPDLMLFFQREFIDDGKKGIFSGLALELKVIYANGTKNKASDAQKKILNELAKNGWVARVVWTFEDAKKEIDQYLNIKHQKN